jgi:hypothetical protein
MRVPKIVNGMGWTGCFHRPGSLPRPLRFAADLVLMSYTAATASKKADIKKKSRQLALRVSV